MIDLPALLLVGATGKSTGKTELVCRFIEAFGSRLDVVGIKITTLSTHGEEIPHSGQPSPIVSGQPDIYQLFEEREMSGDTDTSRMLSSGAKRAFWLRGREEHLESRFNNLLDIIGKQAVIICESNTLRRFVKPGIFLMIVPDVLHSIKPSFRDLVDFADRIVHTDGLSFSISPDEISFQRGRWFLAFPSR